MSAQLSTKRALKKVAQSAKTALATSSAKKLRLNKPIVVTPVEKRTRKPSLKVLESGAAVSHVTQKHGVAVS